MNATQRKTKELKGGKKRQYSARRKLTRTSTDSKRRNPLKSASATTVSPRVSSTAVKSVNLQTSTNSKRRNPLRSATTVSSRVSSTVKSVTLHQSFEIQRSLNFTELMPALIHPHLRFLRTEELDRIHRLPTDTQKANELLVVLARRSSLVAIKFLASLWLTREHLGHEDLFCRIFPHLPVDKFQSVIQLCKSVSPSSPQRPPAFIELQGDLTDAKFLKVQTHLWEVFGRGEYSTIAQLTGQLRSSPSPEWVIVGMWFESMNCVTLHNCKDHLKCVTEFLKPALEKCKHPNVTNQSILEGRIYLRMSQVFLTRGEKAIAEDYTERAKELLSLTRGYDRGKLFLREAKVFSALSFREEWRREEVEKMYQYALDNFDEHHACCRPTVHLSLAAFYLNISFGSKLESDSPAPSVSDEDIRKAKAHLEAVKGIFLPSMKLCEQALLLAELLRLEGKLEKAVEAFQETVEKCRDAKLCNLVSVAEHRCQLSRLQIEKSAFLDGLVGEIPMT